MSDNYRKKYQHEELVLFLDDCFCDEETAATLRNAGYLVELMDHHFPGAASGKREQSVKDPKVIRLSHNKGWLIVTKDSNMRITHVEEFKSHPNATVLATACNPCCDIEVWAQSLVRIQPELRRKFAKQIRPWYAQFNRQGQITTCKTIDTQTTRRNRPREV